MHYDVSTNASDSCYRMVLGRANKSTEPLALNFGSERGTMPLDGRSEVFRAFSQILNRSFTLREALNGALPRIVEMADAEAGWIFFYDPESGNASLAADVNLPPSLLVASKRRMAGDCRCLQKLRDGELTQAVNLIECQRLEQALPGSPEKHRHATIPLLAQSDTAVGVLNLLVLPGRSLSDRDLNVLEALGNELAVAIQRAHLFETVRDREATTRELMQRLLTAQEEERRRIAQDLHDHAGQIMTALMMQLTFLVDHIDDTDKATLAEDLGRFRDITGQGLDELHKLVYDLRPLILDDYGLGPAVRSYVETHLQPAGLEVDLQIIGLQDRMPRDIELAAYRIIQEAATNTLRYAEAKRVEIRIDRRKDWLIVMVRDDGKGFDQEEARSKKSLGLYGMRERAELVGGNVQVLSVAGAGTTIVARLPFLVEKPGV
jgi:signal transduction histidine kinase